MLACGAVAGTQGGTRTRTPFRAPISETGVYSNSSHLSMFANGSIVWYPLTESHGHLRRVGPALSC